MPHPVPYLSFDGNCYEAMRFYEEALGGKLEKLVRHADTPWAFDVPEEQRQLIVHACLNLPGSGQLYAGDRCPQQAYEGMKGVSLTLCYETVEEAQRIFQALAEGGRITMPLQAAFWAKIFGMVTDRFGTSWIINGESQDYQTR